MLRRRIGSLALLGAVVALGFGCAETQAPIDRTEVNALPKSLFTGEWYYQQTVVEVPGTATFTMVGNTNYNGMHRVRWDIQRDWLYARKSYEHVKGAKQTSEDTGEYKGAIVGAWRILGHFDVKRGYNPTTGEQNNVLEENQGDCKWYDCTHLRVDFSTNKAIEYMFLDHDEDMKKEPVPFYYEDDNDPKFRPIFDQAAGYMDFVTAMAVNPGQFSFNYNSKKYTYPLCWLFRYEDAECNTQIVKIRNSFMRRHPNRDFQPRRHQGTVTEWFGFFTSDRLVWDTKVGITQKSRVELINRHNIWKNWHYADKPCDPAAAQDTCAKEPGSECDAMIQFHKNDVWTDTDADGLPDAYEKVLGTDPNKADSNGNGVVDQYDDHDGNGKQDLFDYYVWAADNMEYRCTIPQDKRVPRPVAYFNPGDFPRDLVCDKDDKGTGPCKAWKFSADKKVQEDVWSALHHVSNDYDNAWWKVFLMGGYGWPYAKYQRWIDTRNPKDPAFNDKDREVLGRFGDINDPNGKNGVYAYVICPNSPVQDSDPWPCRFNHKSWEEAKQLIADGKDNMAARPLVRPGDIRFSQVHFVKDYYSGIGLLGLGPSHTDPRTGENLAGVANVYALNDWAANYVREMVGLLNGSISPTEYVDGVDLEKWLKYVKDKSGKSSGQFAKTYTHTQLKSMYQSMVQPWMKRIQKLGNAKDLDNMKDSLGRPMNNKQKRRALISAMGKSGLFDPAGTPLSLSLLKGTPLEKRMMDNEVLLASGFGPGQVTDVNDDVLAAASIARGGFVRMIEAQEQFRWDLANKRNMYFVGMADDALVGLAHRLKGLSDEQVYLKARDIIMRAVLTHEIGHTVGLHHNWGGSEDVVNFHPEYWQLRTNNFQETKLCTGPWSPTPGAQPTAGDGKLCPFFVKPMNDYQRGTDAQNKTQNIKAMYEYAYTSVMDYAGRYTIDGAGLGRYDVAALVYGHADKVEVFKNDHGLTLNLFDEWHSTDGNPLILYSSGPQSFHYTNWYSQMGKDLFDGNNRVMVDWRKVEPIVDGNGRTTGFGYKDGNKVLPRVPYVFCTYTRGDISDGCNTRDFGSDTFERMKQHVDNWDTWYPIRSFTRYRFGLDAGYYMRRNFRMYKRLKDFNNTYALYQGLFRQWYTPAQISNFFTDPVNGWGAYTIAMKDAFNMALRTLAMPDVKGFQDKAEEPDGQVIYSEAVFTGLFDTNIVNGRYFTTSWSDTNFNRDFGLKWWQGLHHFGFYIDKVMALLTLVNAQTYFVARDTAEDIRTWRISFFNNFQTQLIDFFGSVLSIDHETHAPWFDPSKPRDQTVTDSSGVTWINGIAQRDYSATTVDGKSKFLLKTDVAKPAQGAAVESATRFTLQMYMGVIGILGFHDNFNNEFLERSVMWKLGSTTQGGWDVKPNANIDGTTTFEDPFNGATYVGVAYKDKRGIAQRMIAYANRLKGRTQYCNTTAGQPDSCTTADPRAEQALFEYRQLMDIMIQASGIARFAVPWSWNPFDP